LSADKKITIEAAGSKAWGAQVEVIWFVHTAKRHESTGKEN
jgi:hypothetical protein